MPVQEAVDLQMGARIREEGLQRSRAQELYLTPSTVRTYLQRIREKYDRVGRPARTKAALAARAIQDGYIRLDEL